MHSRALRVLIALAGIALGVAAYNVQVDNLGAGTTHVHSAAGVIAGWSFLFAGIAAWSRRPGNRLGPLIVATSFALLARQLRYSHDALAFTTFFAVGELGYALIAHTALAYPSGRLTDRFERIFVEAMYVIVLAFPLAILLVHGPTDHLRTSARSRGKASSRSARSPGPRASSRTRMRSSDTGSSPALSSHSPCESSGGRRRTHGAC